jgi:hypothetical protein
MSTKTDRMASLCDILIIFELFFQYSLWLVSILSTAARIMCFVLHLINVLSEPSRGFVTNCKVKIILTKLSMVKYKVTIYDNDDE